MAITRKMNEAAPSYTNERAYRASKLVEKWSQMPQIGKGINKMSESKARNLAILLENQSKYMSRMTEGVFADAFNGTTPENLLKLIRITYPNSVRGDLFTEFAMETANDSIKYIEPIYNGGNTPIYELPGDKTGLGAKVDTAPATGDYLCFNAANDQVIGAKIGTSTVGTVATSVAIPTVYYVAKGADVNNGLAEGEIDETTMGEVELKVRSYTFQPKAYTLGVSWSQLAELILDSSFGVSAEEMLMDSAAQEIKKALDFQAIALAVAAAPAAKAVTFNAMNEGVTSTASASYNGESYFQRAQVVMQAVAKCKNSIYNTLQRGGVSAIVGSPDTIEYFKLHKGFTNKGEQQACGAYKAGEVDGIELYVAPKALFGDAEGAITTWKNEAAGTDVSIAIGTLMALYSTGALARKGIYKEAGLANFSDTVVLNAEYLRKLTISNLA